MQFMGHLTTWFSTDYHLEFSPKNEVCHSVFTLNPLLKLTELRIHPIESPLRRCCRKSLFSMQIRRGDGRKISESSFLWWTPKSFNLRIIEQERCDLDYTYCTTLEFELVFGIPDCDFLGLKKTSVVKLLKDLLMMIQSPFSPVKVWLINSTIVLSAFLMMQVFF